MRTLLFFAIIILSSASIAQINAIRDGSCIATLGRVHKGYLTKEELKNIDSIEILFVNSLKNYTITEFTMGGGFPEGRGSSDYETTSYTNKLTSVMKNMIQNFPISESIYVGGIKYKLKGDTVTYGCNSNITITINGPKVCLVDKFNDELIIGKSRNRDPVKILKKVFLSSDSLLVTTPFELDKYMNLMDFVENPQCFKIDTNIIVKSYDICIDYGQEKYTSLHVESNRITDKIKKLVKKAKKGCDVFIYDIKAQDKSGNDIETGYIELRIIISG